ncbi:hypothetical protein L873DRAFT_860563 [Choiromyces venosus 120613-1]|uniref:Transmembrane protein n=1 Tax=Choiromyces venosus 120613-1 TaxID=1336337 RepID=A0A3N4K1T2_9PEZI|nr:hypothetical protein L873DRAFT_860563 [Choiromyces venosus 120613-1]
MSRTSCSYSQYHYSQTYSASPSLSIERKQSLPNLSYCISSSSSSACLFSINRLKRYTSVTSFPFSLFSFLSVLMFVWFWFWLLFDSCIILLSPLSVGGRGKGGGYEFNGLILYDFFFLFLGGLWSGVDYYYKVEISTVS